MGFPWIQSPPGVHVVVCCTAGRPVPVACVVPINVIICNGITIRCWLCGFSMECQVLSCKNNVVSALISRSFWCFNHKKVKVWILLKVTACHQGVWKMWALPVRDGPCRDTTELHCGNSKCFWSLNRASCRYLGLCCRDLDHFQSVSAIPRLCGRALLLSLPSCCFFSEKNLPGFVTVATSCLQILAK